MPKKINDAEVIIVAAGKSTRFKSRKSKIFYNLCGKPVIVHSIRCFLSRFRQEDIIVVASKTNIRMMKSLLEKNSLEKVRVVEGGDERSNSVYNGLIKAEKNKVLIHDGARCFVPQKSIDELYLALRRRGECVVLAISPSETVRTYKEDEIMTLNRENVYLMQTPQCSFRDEYSAILNKHIKRKSNFTDDAEYFIRENKRVVIIKGDKRNIKVTSTEDIPFAESIIERGKKCS